MAETASERALEHVLNRAENLPSVPAVALEVLRLTQDESATLDQLAQTLSMDPALSSKLLRVANSSLFNPGSQVSTLQRAALVLGMKTVKFMSLSFSLVGSLPDRGSGPFDFQGYWRRSAVCGVSARSLAEHLGKGLRDEAFLAGLLARIGQLVLGHCLADRYAEVLSRAEGAWPEPDLERSVLGYDSFELGAALLRSWELPPLITGCVTSLAQPDSDDAGPHAELVPILRLALDFERLLCGADRRGAMEQLLARASESFGLEDEQVNEILTGLESSIAETAATLEIDMRGFSLEQVVSEARELLVAETLGVVTEMARVERQAEHLASRNRQLREEARRDGLTGLPDRACFDETLQVCLAELTTGAAGDGLGLLMIDVDRFKAINDTHGHQIGDDVLRMVGAAIRSTIRGGDVAARYGGEEFGIIMPGACRAGLETAAERIRAAIEAARLPEYGDALCVTVSIGGAQTQRGQSRIDARSLVQLADRALYRAKGEGRNRCVFAGEGEAG